MKMNNQENRGLTAKAVQEEAITEKVDKRNNELLELIKERKFYQMDIIRGVRKANPVRFNDVYLVGGDKWQAKIWRNGKYVAIGSLHKDKEKAAQEAVELKAANGIITNPYKEVEIIFDNMAKERKDYNVERIERAKEKAKKKAAIEDYIKENTIQIEEGIKLFENLFTFTYSLISDRAKNERLDFEEFERLKPFFLVNGSLYQVSFPHNGKIYKSNPLTGFKTAKFAYDYMREYLEGTIEHGEPIREDSALSGVD